jgi:predicted RNA-binding Zn ribbon-like protein
MKNRKLLHLGAKPAPDDLALVQGFVNYVGWLSRKTDIDRPGALKTWLVRHGLLSGAVPVSEDNVRSAVALQVSLRSLLRANSGEALEKNAVKRLNRLARQCNLTMVFGSDGSARLDAATRGVERALGKILVVVVKAMADGNWGRLKVCRNQHCQWAFFDSSKNRSGRWCAMQACGSRAKASAYRSRQKREMAKP